MSNRLPDNNNNENNNNHLHITEEVGNLCDHCRWQDVCHKYQEIDEALYALRQKMFKENTIDLNMITTVTYCPTYSPDPLLADDEVEDEEQ